MQKPNPTESVGRQWRYPRSRGPITKGTRSTEGAGERFDSLWFSLTVFKSSPKTLLKCPAHRDFLVVEYPRPLWKKCFGIRGKFRSASTIPPTSVAWRWGLSRKQVLRIGAWFRTILWHYTASGNFHRKFKQLVPCRNGALQLLPRFEDSQNQYRKITIKLKGAVWKK